jgi:predicted nucleic acid-binding protein
LADFDLRLAVVDASVVVRWFRPEASPYARPIASLRDRVVAGSTLVAAPLHLAYEVPSVFAKAVHRREQSIEDAQAQFALFSRFCSEIRLLRSRQVDEHALRLSAHLRCSFYDGLYLALAEELECPFVHADARLRNAIAGRSPRELWIEDVERP